jgi:GntR family transcriptional repressor for pyruvate dehydrogenase complex
VEDASIPAVGSKTSTGSLDLASVRPMRRRSLPEEIVNQLLELIAASDSPGHQLPPERFLSERLGVSRASLREALSALNHLGVLEVRGKRKYGNPVRARAHLVARSTAGGSEQELVTDPIKVRRMLEPEIAAMAAEHAAEKALDEIEQWLRLMQEGVRRGERILEYDSSFHVAIARATSNPMLVLLIGALTDALVESRELSFGPREAAETALAGHRAILDALRAHDPERAREAMRKHLDDVEQLIRASFQQGGGSLR